MYSKFGAGVIWTKCFFHIDADDEDAPAAAVAAPPVKETGKKKKLINQFNFCERAALTFNNPSRVKFRSFQFFLLRIKKKSPLETRFHIFRQWKHRRYHRPDQHLAQMCCNGSSMIRMQKISSNRNAKKKKIKKYFLFYLYDWLSKMLKRLMSFIGGWWNGSSSEKGRGKS